MISTYLISVILVVIIFFSDINHAAEEKIDFGYTGTKGPNFWHLLSEESAICQTGKKQSPIDITSEDLKTFAEAPQPLFKDANNVESLHNGNTVEISMGVEETPLPAEITVDGEKYELQQFHFHTPSEHRINGQHTDIEQHLVFQSETGKISVVAVLYNVGTKSSKFMAPIIKNLPKTEGEKKEIENINLSGLLNDVKNVTESFTYSGSLTTPPCTEGVTWYVNQGIQSVSVNQFSELRDVIGFNSRFTQLREGEEPVEPVETNSYKKRSLYSHSRFSKF